MSRSRCKCVYIPENVRGKRAILYIRKNSIRAVAAFRRVFFYSLAFPPLPDTRRQENILRNITRPCNGSRLECSSRERYSLVLRQCRFSKTSIGYVRDATPRRSRAAAREPEFMTTNSLVTRSLGDGTRSGFVGERDDFSRNYASLSVLSRSFSLPPSLLLSPSYILRNRMWTA